MKTYKVYARIKHKPDLVFVDAMSFEQAKYLVMLRFPTAAVTKVVEVSRG